MVDFLFEVVIEAVFEFLIHVVAQWGFNTVADLMRAKVTRYTLSVVAGFGFGLWWGARLAGADLAGRPRLFCVTLAVAAVALVAAFDRMRRGREGARPRGAAGLLVAPWHWDAPRLASFALLNVAVAAGIDVGYTPG